MGGRGGREGERGEGEKTRVNCHVGNSEASRSLKWGLPGGMNLDLVKGD